MILRERTLVLEVDAHSAAVYIPLPICVAACNTNNSICAHTVTVRLSDISDITLEVPPPAACNEPVGVPVLCVWTEGQQQQGGVFGGIGRRPHIAVDSPKDFEGFKAAVMQQREKVNGGYVIDDPPAEILKAASDAKGSGNVFSRMMGNMMMNVGGFGGANMAATMAGAQAQAQAGAFNTGGGFNSMQMNQVRIKKHVEDNDNDNEKDKPTPKPTRA